MSKIHLQLVTPNGTLFDEKFDSITLPTIDGQITILPNHAPLVAILSTGEAKVTTGNRNQFVHVEGGLAYVKGGNEVSLLADGAEHTERLNEAQILAAKKRAEELMSQDNIADEEYAQAAASLELNISKLSAIRRHAHRSRHPITSEGVFND